MRVEQPHAKERDSMKESDSEIEAGRSDGESLWEFVKPRGMGRRQFLRLMMAGGAAAVLSACIGTEPSSGLPPQAQVDTDSVSDSPWFKDAGPFIKHNDKSLEAKLEKMQGLITPNRLFVRNNSQSLAINSSAWRLQVEGDAVTEHAELTYGDIRGLPSRTITSYLRVRGQSPGNVQRRKRADGVRHTVEGGWHR